MPMSIDLNKTKYLSYKGPEPFVFIRAFKSEEKELNRIADELYLRKIRFFYDCVKGNNTHLPEEVAGAILNSELCIFILSAKAQDDLDLRNSINYALSLKKKVLCLKDEAFELLHGLNVQLANVSFYDDHLKLIAENDLSACQGEGQLLNYGDDGR